MTEKQLRGWKEIAAYFDATDRTVQRWEQKLGLPVHRVGTVVYANIAELEEWRKSAQGRRGTDARQALGENENDFDGDEPATPETTEAPEAPVEPVAATAEPAPSVALATDGPGSPDPAPVPETGEPSPRADGPGTASQQVASARAGLRVWATTGFALLATVVAAIAWLAAGRTGDAASADGVETAAVHPADPATGVPASATSKALPANPLARFGGTDPGPWPMVLHDPQRTNASHFAGPQAPTGARALFALPWVPEAANHPLPLAIDRDGTIIIGSCGSLEGRGPDGRSRWQTELGTPGRREEPGGITLAEGGVGLTVRDCPDSPDTAPRVGLYSIAQGSVKRREPHPGGPWGPLVAPTLPMVTIDEFTMLRAYDHLPRVVWMTDLPGYSSAPPAAGVDGTLFVATDGGMFNQPSLWAVGKDGVVRWSTSNAKLPSQVVVHPSGAVLMADRTERFLRAYDPHDGRTLWTRSVEGDIPFLPMAVAHSGDVFLRTSDALVALAPDGSVRWRFAPGGRGGWTPPLADVDGNVYVVFGDAVHSLTAEGARRWEITVPGARDLFIAAPGVLYVTTSATATTSASTATPATPLPSARSMRSAPSLVAIGSSPAQ